jgi:hypothetical protein
MRICRLILAAFMFLLGFGYVNSQDLQITPGDTIYYTAGLTDSFQSHEINGYATNNSGLADTVLWKVLSVTEDSAWSGLSLCDPISCYYFAAGGVYPAVHQFPIGVGQSKLLQWGSSPQCFADSGQFQVFMWLEHDSAASAKTITYKALYTGTCVTAVTQIPAEHLRIYPTMVSQQLTVDGFGGLANVKVYLYDMLGNTLVRQQASASQSMLNLNTSDLNPGIYIVAVEAGGTRILTKRIEKLD